MDAEELTRRFVADVLPYRRQLTLRARRLTANESDAEDLVQDTLLNAYKGFRTLREGSYIQAWLSASCTTPGWTPWACGDGTRTNS